MVSEETLPIMAAVVAVVLAGVAELVHSRRVRRTRYLAFGSSGSERAWAKAAPVLRAVFTGLCAFGLATLAVLPSAASAPKPEDAPKKRLLICLDVSPSMRLKDSGSDGKQPRQIRANEVLRSLLKRIDLASTRVSVVAFYTTARPVVTDTWDLNIVTNILDDLPLEHAFKEGPTSLYAGVREAAAMADKWPARSTTLVVVSDGDTLPDTSAPKLPPSISSVLILGVGDPARGMAIAGRSSRQDTGALKALATRLRGSYWNVNSRHIPSAMLHEAWSAHIQRGDANNRRAVALACLAVGAGGLAALWPLLAAFGAPRQRAATLRGARTNNQTTADEAGGRDGRKRHGAAARQVRDSLARPGPDRTSGRKAGTR